jgi:hypothetical protein
MDVLEKNKARIFGYELGMQSSGVDRMCLIYEIRV